MSIIFKSQARQKLIDHLMQVETKLDPSASPSFIVYKEPPAISTAVEAPSAQSQSPSAGNYIYFLYLALSLSRI